MVNIIVGKYVFVIFLSLYVIRSSRGACTSTKMLKGYMTRVSLGTPALEWFRTVARKSSIGAVGLYGGTLSSCRGAWHSNFTKIPPNYSVSYFNLGSLELCLGGLSPPKHPRGDGTGVISKCFTKIVRSSQKGGPRWPPLSSPLKSADIEFFSPRSHSFAKFSISN